MTPDRCLELSSKIAQQYRDGLITQHEMKGELVLLILELYCDTRVEAFKEAESLAAAV